MIDQFQAFLLLAVTTLFVYIVIRVVQSDRKKARRRTGRRFRLQGGQSSHPEKDGSIPL